MRPIPQSVIDQADMLILAALQGEMLSLLTGLSPNQQTPTALCSLMRFIALQQAAGAQARKGCHARH